MFIKQFEQHIISFNVLNQRKAKSFIRTAEADGGDEAIK